VTVPTTSTTSPPRRRWPRLLSTVMALILALGACTSTTSGTTPAQPAASPQASLKGVCPDPVVIQTNWWPQSEHGAAYQLLGRDAKIDAAHKRVTGTLTVHGKSTGVRIEVRAGGPAVGFQSSAALMYQHPEITLGMVQSDEIVQYSKTQPVLGVVAPLEIDPQIIGWDPKTHPNWHTIADIGQTSTRVLYFQGSAYMEYLIGSGILRRSQVDGGYDGSPSRFVGSSGNVAVQGYATNEPWTYQHEVAAWGKPIAYQLVYDTGYPNYGNVLAVRADKRAALDGCLHRLVPILQQAQIDFITHPDQAIGLIVRLDEAYKGGFVYSKGNAEFAVQQMRRLGIVANGTDPTLGNFDTGRLARLLAITQPIFAGQHKQIRQGLGPVDVATNAYLDPSIGLHQ
jgi:hypothetical protein